MNDFAAKALSSFLHELGGISLFLMRVLRTLFTTRGNFRPILSQMAQVCLRTYSTIIFAGVFVGAIIVIQFNLILQQYDAQTYLGGLNTSAVVREIGPLLISFILAGKVGAFTAAELGTMRVTEQIEAIECLGVNPMQYLVLPRFVAIVLSSLILLGLSLVISIGSALVVATFVAGVNPLQFATSIPRFTGSWTMINGMFKSGIYGVIVALVSCYKGYTTTGGARGVGRAVTLSAVYTMLYIAIADFVSSNILDFIRDVGRLFFGRDGVY